MVQNSVPVSPEYLISSAEFYGKRGILKSAQEVVYNSANQVAVSSREARPSAAGAKIDSGGKALGNRDTVHKLDRGSQSWANIVASNRAPRPYAGGLLNHRSASGSNLEFIAPSSPGVIDIENNLIND
ncbi:hypothetical protein U1Q18_015081 [Sarracenia purpurea var. burkii]